MFILLQNGLAGNYDIMILQCDNYMDNNLFFIASTIYLFIYSYFRFQEPKLLATAVEARTCIDSLFIRRKVEIAMLDDEKLRDLDIHAQEEFNSLSWLRTVAPAFPVNGSKVKELRMYAIQLWTYFISAAMLFPIGHYNSQATSVLQHFVRKMQTC